MSEISVAGNSKREQKHRVIILKVQELFTEVRFLEGLVMDVENAKAGSEIAEVDKDLDLSLAEALIEIPGQLAAIANRMADARVRLRELLF